MWPHPTFRDYDLDKRECTFKSGYTITQISFFWLNGLREDDFVKMPIDFPLFQIISLDR